MSTARPTPVRVRERLRELLAAGRYLPGDRLPTERTLAEQFLASRSTIRDALTLLESDGSIIRKAGSGTYVTEKRAAAVASSSPALASPRDTMEARLILEPRLARAAASNATSEDLDQIAALEINTKIHLASDVFIVHGEALHAAIAASTHNRLLVSMFAQINAVRDQTEWGQLKKRSLTIENRKIYVIEHAAIIKALLMRDGEKAEEAAAIHIKTVRRHMLGE
jgi:DNA-binding FadR family transcriptional regulator